MAHRSAFRVLAAVVVLVTGGTTLAGAASAYPGQDDVERAKQAVTSTAASVGQMQQQLDATQGKMDAADTALSVAAEDYDEARIRLAAATQRAQDARKASDIAAGKLAAARVEVGRVAASAYRDGGIGTLDVVLSAKGPQEVLDRASAMHNLVQRQQAMLRRVDGVRATADAMKADAAKALLEEQTAADAVAKARDAAQRQADAVHATYATEQATQTALVARLAQARRTSIAVEQARQAGLEAEREAEREAKARAAAQRRSRAAAAAAAAASSAAASKSHQQDTAQDDSDDSDDSASTPDAPASDPSPSSGGSSSGSAGGGSSAVAWAKTKVGLPYLWGGDGPGSYDCSGLTMKAWAANGVSLPHSSRLQYTQSEKVSYDAMRPGDLIFYATDTSRPSTIHHVTMYAGGGMMVEAPRTGLDVRVVPVRWGDTMPFAARP